MATTNDATNVSFGKPKATGAVYWAVLGTTVPTDATTALDAGFKGVGFISDDGLVNSVETDTEDVTAWGGVRVLSDQSSFKESFTVNAIETNEQALKLYFGADNVDVQGSDITITETGQPLPAVVIVFETLMTGGRVKRIVVPNGKISDRSGDINYTDGDAIGYPLKFDAFPDSSGNTHTEYIAAVS